MEKIIEVKNLTKKYNGFAAVKRINFDVQKGEVFGFLGPNGAGKTTTISILTTLLFPTSGRVKVAGFDVSDNRDDVRASIGLIFQETTLDDDLSAWENLRIHAALYHVKRTDFENRARDLLTMVGLWERRKSLVKTYSGGMKRRLEIVRGLIHYPKILFMDEPTLGLDPQTRAKIWEYVLDLHRKEGITLLMTTHYLDEAEYCSRIAVIDQGRIVALGAPKELKKKARARNLNDLFLKLTGREIREERPERSSRAHLFGRGMH